MIITCPYCHTSYQVAREAIGAAGRQVQCAQCSRAWQADAQGGNDPIPEPPHPVYQAVPEEKAFTEFEEQKLDEAMEDEARAVAQDWHKVSLNAQRQPKAKTPKAEQADERKRQQAFSKRQVVLSRQLPFARARRGLRVGLILLLVAVLAAGFVLRVEIVRLFPDTAGVYAAIGLPVNIYGLEFRDLDTVRSLRNGEDVLTLSARIYSASNRVVSVPPVIVTLLDARGANVYEWSVKPASADLAPGEFIAFDTQLIAPPTQAVRVRLAFAGSASPVGAASVVPTEGVAPVVEPSGTAASADQAEAPTADDHGEAPAEQAAASEGHH